MKKLSLILCLLLSGATLAQAQISTGESTSQVIRTGNRAEKGDIGMYLGATTTMFKNITSANTDFEALPLINLKYMFSDRVEGRVGIEWWKKSNSTENKDYEMKTSESSIMFYPGVAYHFNRSNILDVYVGGEMPLGWGSNGTNDKEDDYYAHTFNFGLGAFIGFQAYICNLPLALGLEYGVSLNYRHVSDGTFTSEGMTAPANYAKDVDGSKFLLGNQARLTLTYFFKL